MQAVAADTAAWPVERPSRQQRGRHTTDLGRVLGSGCLWVAGLKSPGETFQVPDHGAAEVKAGTKQGPMSVDVHPKKVTASQ